MKKILYLIGFFIALFFSINHFINFYKTKLDKEIENIYDSINLFTSIIYEIKDSYYTDISIKTLVSYAIEGMLEKLDPYSNFLSVAEFNNINEYTTGEFYGIGIQFFKNKNNFVEVLHVIDNSPAKKHGILTGDYLTHINNKSVYNMSLSDVSGELKNNNNSSVSLVLKRSNIKTYKADLQKEIIKIPELLEKTYGSTLYLKVTTFNSNTSKDVKASLKKHYYANSLIIDIRNNGGGLLSEAIELSDMFLDNKLIVSLESKNKNPREIFISEKGDIFNNKPIIILVDESSASSSELFAGALQDNKRAIILGTKTYGKGLVQDILKISDDSYIKITTSEYTLPSNNKVNNIGITPDIIIYKNGKTCKHNCDINYESLKYDEMQYLSKTLNLEPDYQLQEALKLIKTYRK